MKRKVSFGWVGSALILITLIILIGVKLVEPAPSPPGAEAQVETATAQPATLSPSPTTSTPSASTEDHPSPDQVWSLEEANLIPDQTTRAAQLAPVATQRYIQAVPAVIAQPTAADVTFRVVRESSGIDWHACQSHDACYITTYATFETKRGNAVLNTYIASPHTTLWMESATEGWKAQQDVQIEMR